MPTLISMGGVERKLFAEIRAGRPPEDLKSSYSTLFRIPARLFNSARISALGKISSAQECQALNIQDLTVRTKSLEKKLAKIKDPFKKHQKARRLGILKGRLERLILDQASGRVRIAFGSKKLWRAQSHLEANSYSSHQEWLEEWRSARSSEFFIVGSKEETGAVSSARLPSRKTGGLPSGSDCPMLSQRAGANTWNVTTWTSTTGGNDFRPS